jgi:signal transduction histidine kinase
VRLEQVLTNLVDNAVKYSPAGGVIQIRLTVEDGAGESAGPRAHLVVADEGIGIPPTELGRIFQPFMRASNAVERQYPGLGIGLAVSKEIIGRDGGQIWVESKGVDKGSQFHVVLPLHES